MANDPFIQGLANSANARADLWQDNAQGFLATLAELARSTFTPTLARTDLPFTFAHFSEMRAAIDSTPNKPSGLTPSLPSDPGDVPNISIRELTSTTVPTFSESAPSLSLPTRPSLVTPSRPGAPTLRSLTSPVAPDVVLPEAPVVSRVAFPDAPSIQLPTFDRVFPADQAFLLQTTRFDWVEDPLPTPLLDRAGELMLQDLNEGGYGIHPDDEEALWERTRDREASQLVTVNYEAADAFASRGFSFPPGALARRQDEARREVQLRMSEANREVSIARADLLRQARQFAVQQGLSIDSTRLTQHGFRMERALNAARFSAEFAIAVHDAGIRAYNARIEGFNAFTQGYRSRLEGELAKVQIFREQVQAAVAQQQAQAVEVELYTALVNAARSRVELFETQVRAVAVEADIERLKVEQFRSQIEAFVAEVRANATEFEAYEAAVRGELAKAQVFSTQVDAFRSQVQASSVTAEIEARKVQTDIDRSRMQLAGYATTIDKYRVDVQTELARIETRLREYVADVEVYRAALGAWDGLMRGTIAEGDSLNVQVARQVELEQVNAKLQLEGVIEAARRRFDAANSGTETSKAFADLAASSLSTISAQFTEVV